MHPATLHGVGVITKLYFAIFAAFKQSMTLNLAQGPFKVIDFGTGRKCVYLFLLLVNSNLDPILHRFRDTYQVHTRCGHTFRREQMTPYGLANYQSVKKPTEAFLVLLRPV